MRLFFLTLLGWLAVTDLVCLGVMWRATRRWRVARWALMGFVGLMLGGLVWLIAGRVWSEGEVREIPRVLLITVMIWHLMMAPVLWLGLCAWGVGSLIRRAVERMRQGSGRSAAAGVDQGRRDFLRVTLLSAAPVTVVGATAVSLDQLEGFRSRTIEVTWPGLSARLDGVRLAHVSDVHVGQLTRGAVMDAMVEAVNRMDADLALFTGDLINYALDDLPVGLEFLGRLRARHGTFAVEGNHDLIEDAAAFRRRARASHIPYLWNEAATVEVRGEPIQILGKGWRGDWGWARAQRDPERFGIVLTHHPHDFDEAARLGIPLTLAGHTHGGQIMWNDAVGFGPLLFRYWSGLYRKGDAALVVSNGAGNWFPLRIGASAEVIEVILRRG